MDNDKDKDSDGTSDESSDDSDPGFDVNPVYKSSAKLSIVNHSNGKRTKSCLWPRKQSVPELYLLQMTKPCW